MMLKSPYAVFVSFFVDVILFFCLFVCFFIYLFNIYLFINSPSSLEALQVALECQRQC